MNLKGESHWCIGYINFTCLLFLLSYSRFFIHFITPSLAYSFSLSYSNKLISLLCKPTYFPHPFLIYLLTPSLIHSLDPLPHWLFLFISPIMYGLLGLFKALKPSPSSFNVLWCLPIKNLEEI